MKTENRKPNRLKELRDRSRLTLEEVGMITGYSVATISRHEDGSRSLSEDAVLKYASLYKVPTHQIFMDAMIGDPEDDDE